MYGYIYKTTNLINGKIYVGKHHYDGFDRNYYGSGKYLWNAIHKYGKENFSVEMLDTANSRAELNDKEQYWIRKLNSKDKRVGYNLTYGGDGMSPMPDDVRQAISQTLSGRKLSDSPEDVEKRSQAQRGKHHLTDEQIHALHIARINSGCYSRHKPMSQETKKKIGKANGHPKDKFWVTNGEEDKFILKVDLQKYLDRGYVRGQSIRRNKIHMTDGIREIVVSRDSEQDFIERGFKRGRLNHNTN